MIRQILQTPRSIAKIGTVRFPVCHAALACARFSTLKRAELPEQLGNLSAERKQRLENVLERNDSNDWFVDKKFEEKWQRNIESAEKRAIGEQEPEVEFSGALSPQDCVQILMDEHAKNVKIIDVRGKCNWTNFLVLADGANKRHLYNMADAVRQLAKKRDAIGSRQFTPESLSIQGEDSSDWMVLDLGDIIVHTFTENARQFYNLDGLWEQEDPFEETTPNFDRQSTLQNICESN